MPKCVAAASASEFAPNAFLRIAPDNTITVISKHIEFGQGPYTGIATILADELDADWSQIRVELAPADHEKYANLSFGPVQGTGGSSAMANSWEQLRNAGAEARARLVAAAAKEWNVEPNDCVIRRTEDGGAELMFGSQLQTVDQAVAAKVLGLKPAQVKIKTLLAGGSFGRRATPAGDMAAEAAHVLFAAKHKGPIKIIWTREDDIKGGRYRPYSCTT